MNLTLSPGVGYHGHHPYDWVRVYDSSTLIFSLIQHLRGHIFSFFSIISYCFRIEFMISSFFLFLNWKSFFFLSSVQFSSFAQSCPTLCDPVNRSMPGLPVHHQLPEFTQTHIHRVSDAIQPSQPLSSPSPPAPNPSQHKSLFQ